MNLDTIKHELKGYFINKVISTGGVAKETLCKKIDNADYVVCENMDTPNGIKTAYDHCLNQINNQILDPSVSICSLSEVLPVIHGNVFDSYKMRERRIEQHIDWADCVEREENQFQPNKYVVKNKKPKGFTYWIVDGEKLTEINEDILSDDLKENAVLIKYPKLLRTALKDNLINEYEEQYLEEVTKYNNI